MEQVVGEGLPMAVLAVSAGGVALLQAVTQLQEQSIGHLVKCGTIGVLLYLGGSTAGGWVQDFFEQMVLLLSTIGGRR
jgi:type III secretory pathway component EscS